MLKLYVKKPDKLVISRTVLGHYYDDQKSAYAFLLCLTWQIIRKKYDLLILEENN